MEGHFSLQNTRNYFTTDKLSKCGKICAEYIWIDATGINMRSKTKVIDDKVNKLEDLSEWNFDGSSCGMADTESSEVILMPVCYCKDPFRDDDDVLVLCDTYIAQEDGEKKPANTNFRYFAEKILEGSEEVEPLYGIEQEYTLFERISNFTKWPLGWPKEGYPSNQGPYYCSAGASVCYGRAIVEKHMKACLTAGLKLSGTNGEVLPGSWEFQIGPSPGLEVGDHLWIARYILTRITEDLGIGVSFHPKPIEGEWNGSACHTNFSTKEMRDKKDKDDLIEIVKKLEKDHETHIKLYGRGNEQRLSGNCETAKIDEFTYGVGKLNLKSGIEVLTMSF